MQKLLSIVGLSLFLSGCGLYSPPTSKPAAPGESVPLIYPPVDPVEQALEEQAKTNRPSHDKKDTEIKDMHVGKKTS